MVPFCSLVRLLFGDLRPKNQIHSHIPSQFVQLGQALA